LNTFTNCARRAIKFDASNGIIEDNLMETAVTDGGTSAVLLQFFSIQGGIAVRNLQVRRNTFRVRGTNLMGFFGTNDSRDIIIEDNVFDADQLEAGTVINFSTNDTQGGLYDGDVSNLVFRNNTITNGIFNVGSLYYVLDGEDEPIIENNTQIIDNNSLGAYRGAINIGGSTLSGTMRGWNEIRFKNHNITVSSSSGIFTGAFGTNGVEPKNVVLDNVDITYVSASPRDVFAGVRRSKACPTCPVVRQMVDFDSTNTIIDCDIVGYSGTGSMGFNVAAERTVNIINSFGDGGTPITFDNGE
jgi:hypothetical protein